MTSLLLKLLDAGLIQGLNGEDSRFSKIEQAAKIIASDLKSNPKGLIRAILAALDPDIPVDDPFIIKAAAALSSEWPTMRSVYTDMPVNLLRAILIDACYATLEEKANASIIWLTAVDTLPFLKLGQEKHIILEVMQHSLIEAETHQKDPTRKTLTSNISSQNPYELNMESYEHQKIDRDNLLVSILGATTPNNNLGKNPENPNPNWPLAMNNQHAQNWMAWAAEYSERFSELLANELDTLSDDLCNGLNGVQDSLQQLVIYINKTLTANQQHLLNSQNHSAQKNQLDTLWWYEALYSPSAQCSYRELSPTLATVLMALDLLELLIKPTPTSVAYVLAEAVNRLTDADYSKKYSLSEFLEQLHQEQKRFPKSLLDKLTAPPEVGRTSLRDLIISVLKSPQPNINEGIKRSGLDGDISLSLPALARAFFRQEQAVQLAEQ